VALEQQPAEATPHGGDALQQHTEQHADQDPAKQEVKPPVLPPSDDFSTQYGHMLEWLKAAQVGHRVLTCHAVHESLLGSGAHLFHCSLCHLQHVRLVCMKQHISCIAGSQYPRQVVVFTSGWRYLHPVMWL
jgi:hypothetical protein